MCGGKAKRCEDEEEGVAIGDHERSLCGTEIIKWRKRRVGQAFRGDY